MELAQDTTLDDDDGSCWDLYQRAFVDLRPNAVQEHLLTGTEFTDVLKDERLVKYTVHDRERGRLAALATMTTDLEAVHLVSPAYFARHWADHYRNRRIWYVQFVAVDPDYQGSGVFPVMVERLCQEARRDGGVVCLDICEYRESGMALPDVLERLVHHYSPTAQRHRLDAQVYWGYEFPRPA
jgi:GNAT superfamily N-acetyltransferase